ncbi:MAG: glycosyltransferase family 4 protein [Deltaproteobacteria bacterium]|nr:glycosyltransferase family 4 protein [Deltaproteobacteria bacterium]
MKLQSLILVAENVSLNMGGEAAEGIIYFRKLRKRNIDVRLVCHIRVKDELHKELSPEEFEKVCFIKDMLLQRFFWNIGKNLPTRIKELVLGQLIHLIFQFQAKKTVRILVRENKIQIVFQPTPNTPLSVSCMYNLGVPVVLGPMKGGMDFPLSFRHMDSIPVRMGLVCAKCLAMLLNKFIPGKLLADVLIIGDKETKQLLPSGYGGRVATLFECAVDLSIWKRTKPRVFRHDRPVRFVFSGRLVDWKGVRFLIEAFRLLTLEIDAYLEIVGDGPLIGRLRDQVESLKISDYVRFHGWLPHEEMTEVLLCSDVFVMPSLRESCGISILEAMALSLPVIAVDWGGPARILNSACGILVNPGSHALLVPEFFYAMKRLAGSSSLREKMGNAGRMHLISSHFDWDSKIDGLIDIFKNSLGSCK